MRTPPGRRRCSNGRRHRFVDLAEPGFGLALINDAKYGHSVRGNVLGLSLVRSPVYPDPLADEGEQRFAYALMPHAGAWHECVRAEAEALNQPLLALSVSGLAEGVLRPLAVEGLPVALAGLKGAEDGDGPRAASLRARRSARAGAAGACRRAGRRQTVDLLERPVEAGAEMRPVRGAELAAQARLSPLRDLRGGSQPLYPDTHKGRGRA